MSQSERPVVVVGIDGSKHSIAALEWAVEEARMRRARLRVVHAWQPPFVEGYPYTGAAFDPTPVEASAHKLVDEAVSAALHPGEDIPVERIVRSGGASSVLLDNADDAALVVVGSRGMGGFRGLVLGSVSQQVANHATCPVVIIHR